MRYEIRCRYATILYYAGKAGERALHGDSHSPRVVSLLRLLFACTSADYNIIRARRAHLLKRIPHGARRIATTPMSHKAAGRKCAVSCLTSARLMSIGSNDAPSRLRPFLYGM